MHNKYKKLNICLKILLVTNLFCGIFSIQKYDNVNDALKDYPQQDKKNGKVPKYLYIKLFKEKEKEIDYFSRILYQFMSTTGVRPYFVNLKDNILLGIVPIHLEVDTQVILDTFQDVIQSIEVTTQLKS